jgi:hypothetical protein
MLIFSDANRNRLRNIRKFEEFLSQNMTSMVELRRWKEIDSWSLKSLQLVNTQDLLKLIRAKRIKPSYWKRNRIR